jgi:hypothetical protein
LSGLPTNVASVRLNFDPGDDDAYYETRDALLGELDGWLDGPKAQRDLLISNAGVFLDWRYHYSSGVLDEFADGDVAEFLLSWCPRKLSGPADVADGVCKAVGAYVEFMARTGRLLGGVDRAARLMTLADDLAPTMREEMDNPANFGMGKSLLAGLELSGSAEEVQATLNARMDEFNALPFEERKALTDSFVDPAPEPFELPFLYIPPPVAEVEATAAASPLLAKVEALRDHLGPDGKPLTDKGNLKLADGRALVVLLDTGDEMDPQIGEKTFRTGSTAELRRLNFILDLAKEAGAVRVHKRRLIPVKAWATRPTTHRAAALFAAIIELGPLQSLFSGRYWFFDEFHQLLDDGIVHWLAPLLAADDADLPLDSMIDWTLSVVKQQLAPSVPDLRPQDWDRFTRQDMSRTFEILELAGVVRWTDRIEVPERYGPSSWTGGTVELTALGRHVLPDYLDDAGYTLRRADGIADGDGADLIDGMLSVVETQHEALVAGWQIDRPAVERVQLLTDAVAASDTAEGRLMGFVALDMFDLDVAEPLVRELLDSRVAGHAALWLIAHGRADADTLGCFVDIGALVDVLASNLEDPDVLCDLFTTALDPFKLLEELWRHPAAETALVLDALGGQLPDRKLAKAARKAAMRHRSWMANRS